jgi:hypothetical protein
MVIGAERVEEMGEPVAIGKLRRCHASKGWFASPIKRIDFAVRLVLLRCRWDFVRWRTGEYGSGLVKIGVHLCSRFEACCRVPTSRPRISLEFPNEILGLAQLRRGTAHCESGDAGSRNKVKTAVRAEIGIDDVRCLLRRKTRERNRFREQR